MVKDDKPFFSLDFEAPGTTNLLRVLRGGRCDTLAASKQVGGATIFDKDNH